MYYDERIQGGIFTPVLVVTDCSIFVELEVMNRSILFCTSSAAEGMVWFMRLGVYVPQRDMVVSLGGSVYLSVTVINFTTPISCHNVR